MRRTSMRILLQGAARGAGFVFIGLYAALAAGCVTIRHDLSDMPSISWGAPLRTYEMRQRAWTLGDQFDIRDENRRSAFTVKGKAFSLGDRLSFREAGGNELATISRKVLSLRPDYRIRTRDGMSARIVKKLIPFKRRYAVKVSGADEYLVRGDFWNYEYVFSRGEENVAVVSKQPFAWPDSYRIAILTEENDVLILAAAVVIDLIEHDDADDAGPPPPCE